MKILRWILIPVACITAWYAAFVIGLLILNMAEAFCPKDQMVSGICTAPWWRVVEKSIFCFSAALSAIFVLLSGFFVAPTARNGVAWLVFVLGSMLALWLAVDIGSMWLECVCAIAAGLSTAFLLTRPYFTRGPN